jgi:hypothetical protein
MIAVVSNKIVVNETRPTEPETRPRLASPGRVSDEARLGEATFWLDEARLDFEKASRGEANRLTLTPYHT